MYPLRAAPPDPGQPSRNRDLTLDLGSSSRARGATQQTQLSIDTPLRRLRSLRRRWRATFALRQGTWFARESSMRATRRGVRLWAECLLVFAALCHVHLSPAPNATSELGTLSTITAWLSGARRQVTDPKGKCRHQPAIRCLIRLPAMRWSSCSFYGSDPQPTGRRYLLAVPATMSTASVSVSTPRLMLGSGTGAK